MQPRTALAYVIIPAILFSLLLSSGSAFATTITWTAKTAVPTARTWAAAAVYAGQIYVFGGNNNTTKLTTVERYDPATNTWESRTPMPVGRYAASAVTLGDKIYIIGGVNASNQIVSSLTVYDPLQDSWSEAAAMPTARCRLAAVVTPDGLIYAIGGSTSSTLDLTGYTAVVEAYNPATNQWSTKAPLNTPRVGLAAATAAGKIYAFGGFGKPVGYLARYLLSVEVYDIATNTWSSAASMNNARYGLAAAATTNGLIYLIGGKNDSSVPPSSNEEYNPYTNSTSSVAALPSGQRSELSAVMVPGSADTLYALGGGNLWTPSNSLEAGALSDVPPVTPTGTATTPPGDTTPPAALTDLAAAPGCAAGSVLLTWTAPGDDGALGTAASYQVRYATAPISDQAAWTAATLFTGGIPDPLKAGATQSLTISGLSGGTTYYFAVRAEDENTNLGGLPNLASAQAPAAAIPAPWTVLVYAAADNNLDRYIYEDISGLELAAHNTCLNIALLWDGAYTSGNSAYYHLKFDPHPKTWAAYTQGVNMFPQGELNMGLPATLSDFVAWGKAQYPAEHYALVLRDHGDGLGGMHVDDTNHDFLTIPELDQALDTITGSGADPLDLLFMDACLMGMLEDGYQFRDQAGVYVASEDVTWSSRRSNSHQSYFNALGPATSAAEIGGWIVDGYADWMETDLAGYHFTMSAVDLAALPALADATNALAASLAGDWATYSTQIQNARLATLRYYYTDYIDLYDFASNVYQQIADDEIRAAAQAVMTAVDAYVLVERHSFYQSDSHGVSIFFPLDSSSFYDPDSYDFAVGAVWPGAPRPLAPAASLDPLGWGTLLTQYIAEFPGGPDVSAPPPPLAPQTPRQIFAPLVTH